MAGDVFRPPEASGRSFAQVRGAAALRPGGREKRGRVTAEPGERKAPCEAPAKKRAKRFRPEHLQRCSGRFFGAISVRKRLICALMRGSAPPADPQPFSRAPLRPSSPIQEGRAVRGRRPAPIHGRSFGVRLFRRVIPAARAFPFFQKAARSPAAAAQPKAGRTKIRGLAVRSWTVKAAVSPSAWNTR